MKFGCLSPVRVKLAGEYRLVPCGKCPACLRARSGTWSRRLSVEASQHKYVFFVTLTYSDKFVPIFRPEEAPDYPHFTDFQREQVLSFLSEHEVSEQYLVLRYSDIQLFLKRLRYYVSRCNIPSFEKYIRYYCCGEYGETTKRPHYHLLLFSDSDILCRQTGGNPSQLEMCVRKAWSTTNDYQTERELLGKISFELVDSNAASYVSDYVTSTGTLPKLLQVRAFRPFSMSSRCPPIGALSIDGKAHKEILVNGYDSFVNEQGNEANGNIDIPLFKSLKDKIFPRCYKFGSLSSTDRIISYSLATHPLRGSSFSEFVEFLDTHPRYLSNILRIFEIEDYESFILNPKSYTNLFRQWQQSRMIVYHCSRLGIHMSSYLRYIEKFYLADNYKKLCEQLKFEVDFAFAHDSKYLISYIDPLFWDKNTMSLEDYLITLEGFGFTDTDDPIFYDYRDLPEFQAWKDKLTNYINVGKSYKAIKDYTTRAGKLTNQFVI